MGVHLRRALVLLAIAIAALPARADEIRLKDGKKLYGVIVAYEENMFKVKTDFGFVLVERDKIASIIPAAPPAGSESQPSAKGAADPSKAAPSSQPNAQPAVASAKEAATSATNASAKVVTPAPGKPDKAGKPAASAKPELPAGSKTVDAAAPAIKGNAPVTTTAQLTPAAAPPKAPEAPAISEEVQANIYINHTHGFRMYKAPSWQVMDDARNAMPNAIVAMGTSDESSLLVIGKEKTKEPLDKAAATVEARLRDVYESYRQVSQRKTTLGGSPAVEFHYLGKADEHDWSGTLVVIARNGDIFTVLGMTYADSDLIQIQENVIAKSIASLSFDAH
jgi:hypothetical protein